MKKSAIFPFLLISILAMSVFSQEPPSQLYPFSMEYNPEVNLIRIATPTGYERYPSKKMDLYQAWLTNFPLRAPRTPVARWDGQKVMEADSVTGVIDFGVGTPHQKNADIPVQVIMEFLRVNNALGDFPYIIITGDTVTYNRWLEGEYYYNSAQVLSYKKSATKREASDREYYSYLQFVLHLNEIKTLLKNFIPISEKEVAPGNFFIQFDKESSDSAGHAAVILDVCQNNKDEAMYLVGWGGNPAHDFIVARPRPISARKWFSLDELKEHLKNYGEGNFYRMAAEFPLRKKIQ
jgi:hypothetical protein